LTVLAHMAVGAAVGSFAVGKGTSFALGLAAHVPLDVIPHYEFEKIWFEASVLAVVFGSMLALGFGGTAVFWGAVGGVVPDLENLLWRKGILPGRWKIFPGHAEWLSGIVPHGRCLPLRHAWWQVAIIGVAVLVAVRNLAH
jgi:hypothetical protein